MGFYNFWTGFSESKIHDVQDEVLALVKKHADDNGKSVQFRRVHTRIGGTDKDPHIIHSIECESEGPTTKSTKEKPIVIVHGYAAGSLLFANSLSNLASRTNRKVIAMDWLGCAASSRPSFKLKDENEIIDYFVGSFEDWLEERKIEHFDLIGHSLGGYLSCKYMLRANGREKVDHLVLASPVGFPHCPPPPKDLPFKWKVVKSLWNSGMTPNHLVRGTGAWGGYSLIDKFVIRRFGTRTIGLHGLNEEQHAHLIPTYLHQITAGPPSGEHSLRLLHPGAFAKIPLVDKLKELDDAKILILYGDRDWMARDFESAQEATREMPNAKVTVTKGTHHVYLDPKFDQLVLKFIGSSSESEDDVMLSVQ